MGTRDAQRDAREQTEIGLVAAFMQFHAIHSPGRPYHEVASMAAGALRMIGNIQAPPGTTLPDEVVRLRDACKAAADAYSERMESLITVVRPGVIG